MRWSPIPRRSLLAALLGLSTLAGVLLPGSGGSAVSRAGFDAAAEAGQGVAPDATADASYGGALDAGSTAPDAGPEPGPHPDAQAPDFAGSCETDNPYLVTACYADYPKTGPNPPAVVAFHETAGDGPHHTLATEKQVGSVWGLAYSGQHDGVYAAAFHKRQMAFGPAGPGGIYRIDLSSPAPADPAAGLFAVSTFTVVPNAGEDRHGPAPQRLSDGQARPWAGKTSLGDLDVAPDGSQLFVTNLEDRRIYRFDLPDGGALGSFDHGAAAEMWAEDARPFALKVYGGRLYHGVVRTAEKSHKRDDLAGYVYSSEYDGTGMRLVGEFPLTYPRGTIAIKPIWSWYMNFDHNILLTWLPWIDTIHIRTRSAKWDPTTVYPMPIVADIEFDAQGNMVVGIKDRTLDAGLTTRDFLSSAILYDRFRFERTEWPAVGAGDTLYGVRESPPDDEGLDQAAGPAASDTWLFDPAHEHYADHSMKIDETNLSGLAMVPAQDRLVSAAISMGSSKWNGMPWRADRGAKWYDNVSGARTSIETICSGEIATHY